MKMRFFRLEDFDAICQLLDESGVEPPKEISDIAGGLCIVAEENKEIIGVIWALHGKSTTAYVDYLAVRKGHENQKVFMSLLSRLDFWLKRNGVKRYYFYVVEHSTRFLQLLLRYHSDYNIKLLGRGEIYLFRRELT